VLDTDLTTRLMWYVLFVSIAVALGASLLARRRDHNEARFRLPRPLAYVLFLLGCLLLGIGFRFVAP
jgi:hypothetical protein